MPECACADQPFPFDEVSIPVEWPMPADDSAAVTARFWVGHALGLLGLPKDQVADARLAVSELATNAVRHAAPPYALRVYAGARVIVCEVTDHGPAMPCLPTPAPTMDALTESGRGLAIVASLTDGYCGVQARVASTRPYREGKAVWFALPVTPGDRAPS